jgi:hypothetical protein
MFWRLLYSRCPFSPTPEVIFFVAGAACTTISRNACPGPIEPPAPARPAPHFVVGVRFVNVFCDGVSDGGIRPKPRAARRGHSLALEGALDPVDAIPSTPTIQKMHSIIRICLWSTT